MMRIGQGFDAHVLVAGRPLVLGGVRIDHPLGLEGHSDADVLVHAVCDALLGALGEGDLGRHFPDHDPAYADIDSRDLLRRVIRSMRVRGYRLTNLDSTLVCQEPRLAPHIPAMREHLAADFRVPPEQINVKATTTEKLGFTGRGEGIAATAVVLLERDAQRQAALRATLLT